MSIRIKQAVTVLFGLLLLNSAYLAAFATPSVFYMVNVLLHVAAGTVALLAFAFLVRNEHRWGALMLLAAGAFGAWLAFVGNTLDQRAVLYAHIALGVMAVLLVGQFFRRAALILAALPLLAFIYQKAVPDSADRIRNTAFVPTSMQEEGNGPKSPFWPSSIKTNL